MIWVPWLPLIIFFISFLPLTLLGVFKGWRYALSFTGTLWILTSIFLGINFAIYKYWWIAYKKFFLESKINIDIDTDILSQYYKPQVLIMATGIELILIYPLTFLIMYFVGKITDKYFAHKTKRVDSYQQKIIVRKNLWTSRVLGGLILASSSLLSSSMLASALNSVFAPYKKATDANTIFDKIGKIYTFGLASNSKTSQIMTDFLKNLDSELANNMNELVLFKSNESKNDNILPDPKQIIKFEKNIDIFKDLFIEPEASRGIFDATVNVNKNSLQPLAFDRNTATSFNDQNDNVIGYNKKIFINDIDTLKKYIDDNPLTKKLPSTVVETLKSKIAKRFTSFDKTIFVANFNAATKLFDNKNKEINSRKNSKENYKLKLNEGVNSRKSNFDYLSATSGETIPTDWNEWKSVDFPVRSLDQNNPPSNGTFKDEVANLERLETIKDEKNTIWKSAKNIYDTYHSSTYKPAETDKDRAERNESVKMNEIDDLKSNISELKSDTDGKRRNKQTNESNINKLNSEISNLKNKISSLRTEIRGLETDITKADNKIANIEVEINTLESDIKSIEAQLQDDNLTDEKREQLNARKASEQSNLNNKKSELEALKNNKEKLTAQKTFKNSDLSSNEITLSSNESEINGLKSENENLEREINSNQNSIDRKTNELPTLENELSNLTKIFNTKNREYQDKKIINDRYRSDMESKATDYQNANRMFEAQQNTVNNIEEQYKNKINNVDNINNEIKSNKADYDKLSNINMAFKFTAPAKTWSFNDDDSIYYAEQHSLFLKDKLSQIKKIKDDKQLIYSDMKNKIIDYTSSWLEGGEEWR